ncbi:MAG: SipW-dependent-type signal peptide-containing protein [Patescibacteria group bacterium]
MKKILLSFALIIGTGMVVASATVAFFSDTETSAGNVFTAGTIDLTVDSFGATYNGQSIVGANFSADNLTTQKFFTFNDIKPGDWGIRHISLHGESNPAYACMLLEDKQDQENGINEPESAVDNTPEGELSGRLNMFAWEDRDGDNKYEPLTPNFEPALVGDGASFAPDSFFDITYKVLFDSTSGLGALTQNNVRNVAVAWCAGNQNVVHDNSLGNITCDGGVANDYQTDSFDADVVLYAEQVRNNPNFKCSDLVLP